MLASEYLGDLGGLAGRRRLARLDLRGTGASARPADPASYRCDRQVADVEALRVHLGLTRMDLLGHSAGGTLAIRYAAEHPDRIRTLVLLAPSVRPVGIALTAGTRARALALHTRTLHTNEPWYQDAARAYEAIIAGRGRGADWDAVAPMTYGRWDDAARAHQARLGGQRNGQAARIFNSRGPFDPASTRAALGRLHVPVLIVAGELDWILPPEAAAEYVTLFPDARLVMMPGAGHYPWLDDPLAFVTAVAKFLDTFRNKVSS